ncbi:MAG: hypothetical protein JWO03_2353 [Bacteroidetes bacterium]|nr:hypothetical protein [Bacteroidota bacterium]
MAKLIFKILMILFLLICVGVHVQGLLAPFSSEPVWSHIVHVISYTLCLVSIIRPFSWAWVAYTIGAIYPFLYHGRCAWIQYTVHDRFSAVCILVVVLLPLGSWIVWPERVKNG